MICTIAYLDLLIKNILIVININFMLTSWLKIIEVLFF